MDKKKIILLILLGLAVALIVIIIMVCKGQSSGNGPKYVWQSAPDPGSVCSVPCGGGTRYLNVWCEAVDSTGKDIQVADNSLCDQSSKPANSEVCNTQACQWITGDWGNCSLPCGGGNQIRSVTCEAGDNSKCPLPEPATSQLCNTQACSWDIGPWGSCDQTCGIDGNQTRSVTCPSGETCPLPQPSTTQSCDPAPPLCDWTYTDWTPEKCAICGKGTQTRTGTCPRNNSNCGTEGPLSQSCTSANNCVWETSPAWLPYPPSMLDLSQLDNKTVKIVVAENQYMGLGSIGQATLSPLASAIVYTAYYNTTNKFVTFSARIDGQLNGLSISTVYPNQIVNMVQGVTLALAFVVQNNQIVAAAENVATGELTMIGTNIYYDISEQTPTQPIFWFGQPPTPTPQSVVMNLIPMLSS